jgi:hypothetical protein
MTLLFLATWYKYKFKADTENMLKH